VSRKHFKDLFNFGINVVAFDLLNFFNKRSDNLLVALYLGPLQLGYYNVAYRLLEIMIQLLTNITNQVAVPAFAKLQHEPERVKNAFYKATQLTSLISFPAFLSVAVLSPELVRLLFGEKWLPSIPVMQVLSIMGVLQSIFFFNSTVLLAMGKPNWRLWINCLNAITNFAAFALVVKWGILAVASAFTIRGYLFSPIPILAIQKLIRIKLKDYASQFVAPLTGSLVMVAVLFGIRNVFSGSVNLYSLMVIYILAGAIAYIATLQLIAPKLVRSTLDLVLLALPKSKLKKT
jgi:PST family polysaccharide transporter